MADQLTVGGIWGGAGAGLLGAKIAGFHPLFNFDDRDFVNWDTLRKNFPNLVILKKDNLIPSIPINLIVGSPSCKLFSNLSTKSRAKNQKQLLNAFDNEFVKFIELAVSKKPDFFILENLSNVLNHLDFKNNADWSYDGFSIVDIQNDQYIHYDGYRVQIIILNSKDFYVPQSRKRLFVIGSKWFEPEFSLDYVKDNRDLMIALEDMRYGGTVGEALSNIPDHIENNERPKHSHKRYEGFKNLISGESYYGTQNNRRLHYNKPAWTVASSCSRFVHPTEPRTLSVRETARLMGWPDSFEFCGGMTQQLDQVGRSVVPHIITAISYYLKENMPNV